MKRARAAKSKAAVESGSDVEELPRAKRLKTRRLEFPDHEDLLNVRSIDHTKTWARVRELSSLQLRAAKALATDLKVTFQEAQDLKALAVRVMGNTQRAMDALDDIQADAADLQGLSRNLAIRAQRDAEEEASSESESGENAGRSGGESEGEGAAGEKMEE